MGGSFSSFRYDVYLSFRGEDTRFGFTGSLYNALLAKGIRTFHHDELKLHELRPSHIKAIQDSRILVVILSPNYASSPFCLDELVSILECSESKQGYQLVFPVFYGVNPSAVRQQRGSYGEAMARHEERLEDDMDKVMKWRNALTRVANFTGYQVNRRGEYEYVAINNIVREISRNLVIQIPWERYSGIGSIVVGLVCYALSSSFNRLYGHWTWWLISAYIVSSLVICLFISFPDAWQHRKIFRYKAPFAFLVLISTTLYSYYSDRKSKAKPDAYGIVSSAAFAIMSLCMSKKVACGFLDLMYYFCGLLITQLVEIEPILGLVGFGFSYFLIILRSYFNANSLGTRKKKRLEDIDIEQAPTA